MTRRPLCVTLAAVALAAVLVAAPSGFAARLGSARHGPAAPAKPVGAAVDQGHQSAQGVVQSLTTSLIVLKQLDGSSVSVPLDEHTRVLVDGKAAVLADVEPGFVATATWIGSKPAEELETFGSSLPANAGSEVVQSVLPNAVIVTSGRGTLTIRVSAKTRLFVDGRPARLGDVRPGFTLVTNSSGSKGDKSSAELRFLRPG